MAVNYKSLAKVVGSKRAQAAKKKMESPETKARLAGGSGGGAPKAPAVASIDLVTPQQRATFAAQESAAKGRTTGQYATPIGPQPNASSINNPMYGTNRWNAVNPYTGLATNFSGRAMDFSVLPGGKTSQVPVGEEGGLYSKYANTVYKALDAISGDAARNTGSYIRELAGVDPRQQRNLSQNLQLGADIAATLPIVGGAAKFGFSVAKGVGRLGIEAATSAYRGLGGLTRLIGKYGTKEGTSLWNSLRAGGKSAEQAATQLAQKGDDVVRVPARPQGTNVVDLRRPPVRPPVKPPIAPATSATSGLGRLISTVGKVGTAGIVGWGAVDIGAGVVSTMRGSTAGAPSPTGQAGVSGGSQPAGVGQPAGAQTASSTVQRTAPTSFDSQVSALSAPSGGASFVGGGGGVTGGGGPGIAGSRAQALVGEPSEPAAAAQARAQELARAQVDQAGITASPFGDQIDVGELQTLRDRTKALLDAGLTNETMPEFKANMQAMLSAGIENLRKLQPTPEKPLIDTEEHLALYENVPPDQRRDFIAEMDAYRESLGETDLQKQRADLKLQMNAINQVYQQAIDQIKANPNLPKQLAARRLTEVFEDNKFALSEVMAQLENVEDQLEIIDNKVLGRRSDMQMQMQYDESMFNREEKAWQRRMDQFGMMVESRAIGGMSDRELDQWAAVTGIARGALTKMRENALNMDNEKVVSFQTDGADNLLMVTYDKKNPLNKTVERIGSSVAPSGGGGGGFDDLDILANTVLSAGPVATQQRNFATYEQLKAQDPAKAEEWLYGKVVATMPAAARNDFRVMGSVVDGASSLLGDLEEFAQTNPGVYKAAFNSVAPYLTASRDQKYVELMQRLTASGNEYRNAIFGASLTGNEQTEGLKVVFGKNDDLPTIMTKLQGLAQLGNKVRQRIILDNAGQVSSSVTEGGPGSISVYQNQQNSIDDEEFNQIAGTQSGGDTNWWDTVMGWFK